MNNFTIINTVRHGETDYNRNKRYAETIDVSLNEGGIRDTVEASKKLKLLDMTFDQITISTLKISIETALLLFGDKIDLVKCGLCNERNYGKTQFFGHSEKLKGYIGNVQ